MLYANSINGVKGMRTVLPDARNLPENQTPTTDICSVGSGAAGVTLALELADAGMKVLLLEGGDDLYTEASRSLYAGAFTGPLDSWLDKCRLRMFGGTTNHWAGTCHTFDAIDFEARPHIAYSGRPISLINMC